VSTTRLERFAAPEFVDQLEWSFDEPLRSVHVHRRQVECGTQRHRRTSAYVKGEEIFVPRSLDPASLLGKLVLAHEIAHVLQRRRSRHTTYSRLVRPTDDRLTIEADASRASVTALLGGKAAVRACDTGRGNAQWSEPGHYYTAYFILLAIGVPNDEAASIAFYTQMPDEVVELDAVPRGQEIIGHEVMTVVRDTTQVLLLRPNYSAQVGLTDMLTLKRTRTVQTTIRRTPLKKPSVSAETDDATLARNVQMGLHCLNGGSSEAERRFRKKKLSELCSASRHDKLAIGLALHAFGDSYAHANGGTMYPCGPGHLGLHAHAYSDAPGTISVAFDAGQSVDNLYFRQSDYLTYCKDLYDTVTESFGTLAKSSRAAWQVPAASDKRVAFGERLRLELGAENEARERQSELWEILSAQLAEISSLPNETQQCAAFRKRAFGGTSTVSATMNSYAPENDNSVAWKIFSKRHHKTEQTLARSYALAKSWATANRSVG